MRRIAAAIAIFLGLMAPAFGQVASPPIQIFGAPGSGNGSGCTFANPTATASDTAVNGTASTCMRSDAAPAVQKGGSAQFGVVQVDGTTITASGGVISAVSTGTGNALFGTTTGNTANDFVSMSNTTVGVKDSTYSAASFAPAGQVVRVTGSDPTITAAEWAAYVQFTITGTGRTLTFPASSTLSNNGGAQIDTNAGSVTVTANVADTITYAGATSGAGGSVTLPVSGSYVMSTDGAGKLYISGNTILGSGLNVRAATAQGNGTKAQYSTGTTTTNDCVKFDANGNTVDAGSACGGAGGSPGGSDTQIQYNNASAFGGISTFAYNGSTLVNSANSTASTPSQTWTGTIATGTGTTAFPHLYYNAGTAPTTFGTNGTLFGANFASGYTGNFFDVHVNGGTSTASLTGAGALTVLNIATNGIIIIPATSNYKFSGRANFSSPGDGVINLNNNAGSGFTRLNFGGGTASFSSIKENGTSLNVRLADDSADAGLTSGILTASSTVTFSGVTTGTNADFACFAAGGVMTLQTSACTISSLRFKKDVVPFNSAALPALLSLDVDTFKYKATNKDPNGNVTQLGLIAEDIAAKLPICAEYETDMKTPKSYKQECVIAALVKGMQEQHSEIREMWGAIMLLFAGLCGIGFLQLKR